MVAGGAIGVAGALVVLRFRSADGRTLDSGIGSAIIVRIIDANRAWRASFLVGAAARQFTTKDAGATAVGVTIGGVARVGGIVDTAVTLRARGVVGRAAGEGSRRFVRCRRRLLRVHHR